jgi:hypothetical protein
VENVWVDRERNAGCSTGVASRARWDLAGERGSGRAIRTYAVGSGRCVFSHHGGLNSYHSRCSVATIVCD